MGQEIKKAKMVNKRTVCLSQQTSTEVNYWGSAHISELRWSKAITQLLVRLCYPVLGVLGSWELLQLDKHSKKRYVCMKYQERSIKLRHSLKGVEVEQSNFPIIGLAFLHYFAILRIPNFRFMYHTGSGELLQDSGHAFQEKVSQYEISRKIY